MSTRQVWLIDLDNTLHDASWRVMPEINRRMTAYVAQSLDLSVEAASEVRQRYWLRYGATLLGLVRHHGVCPQDFLQQTHPSHDLSDHLAPHPGLAQRLRLLRGQRWLVTNSPRHYAERVLAHYGITRCFDRVICIDDMRGMGRLRPKPSDWLFRQLRREAARWGRGGPAGLERQRLIFVDDCPHNLRSAHRAGLETARIWASKTVRAAGWRRGKPVSAVRPHFVHRQVHSLAHLARQSPRSPKPRP